MIYVKHTEPGLRLHLGSGEINLQGWVNIDARSFKHTHLQTDKIDVGLSGHDSEYPIDWARLKKHSDRKCKVYLLHGDLTEAQVHSLYVRDDIHAYITATHGEGYGLPIFEAAYSGMPIVATDWSGHLDFLVGKTKINNKLKEKKLFCKVDYELKEIQKEAVWGDILVEGSKWAFPRHNSFMKQMRNIYKNYGMYKSWAQTLKKNLHETHSESEILRKMKSAILDRKEYVIEEEQEVIVL